MPLTDDLSMRVKLNKESFDRSSEKCKDLAEAVIICCKMRNFEAAERLSLKLKEERIKRVGFAKEALQLNERLKKLCA